MSDDLSSSSWATNLQWNLLRTATPMTMTTVHPDTGHLEAYREPHQQLQQQHRPQEQMRSQMFL